MKANDFLAVFKNPVYVFTRVFGLFIIAALTFKHKLIIMGSGVLWFEEKLQTLNLIRLQANSYEIRVFHLISFLLVSFLLTYFLVKQQVKLERLQALRSMSVLLVVAISFIALSGFESNLASGNYYQRMIAVWDPLTMFSSAGSATIIKLSPLGFSMLLGGVLTFVGLNVLKGIWLIRSR